MVYIIVAIVVLIIIGVAVFYAMRFMKGSVTLDLGNRSSFQSNDQITGTVSMELKKASHGFLKASLVGEHEVRERSSSGDGDSTSWEEFFRTDQMLEQEQDFPAGFTKSYEVNLTAPTSSVMHGGVGHAVKEAIDSTDKIPDGLKNFAKAAVSTASQGFGRTRWKVEARFDAKGVDLYTSQRVKIAMTG